MKILTIMLITLGLAMMLGVNTPGGQLAGAVLIVITILLLSPKEKK